jgi:filamentous hemagglutinin family protein
VYANPTGGEFAAGAGEISTLGNLTTIQQDTQRAVVNWQSFSSSANETIKFVQPSSDAAILNRVTGNLPSNLDGVLEGNGRVYLINQNGIVLGKDGIINVNGGFVASTRDVNNEAFMQGGALVYKGESIGDIQILGKVKSAQGDIILIAQKTDIKQGAELLAGGNIKLVAANEVQLTDGKITVKPNTGDAGQITVEGALQAAQVQLLAHNNNLGALAINTAGTIRATGTQNNPDGSVSIMAEGEGSNIKVASTIEATNYDSNKQGGTIIIGRDLETGLLSNSTDASGATLNTNRGFVETSGNWLATYGTRVLAKEWLLDPTNITIAGSGASGTAYAANYTAGADSIILASDINTSLNAGTSVTIATSAAGASAGNITVNQGISKTAGGDATLTLKAHGDIVVTTFSTITSSAGKLNIIFNSDLDGDGSGAISITSASMTSNGGNITMGGGTAGNGTGAAMGSATYKNGFYMFGSTLTSGVGNISIIGQSTNGGTAGALFEYGNLASTSGSFYVKGTAPSTNSNSGSFGVLSRTYSDFTTSSGNITIDATTNASGAGSYGMLIQNGTYTTTTGNITINATSNATGGPYNTGFELGSGGAIVAGTTGTVSITAKSGANAADGLYIDAGSLGIKTTGANVVLTGSKANVNGGAALALTKVTTGGGNLTLTGDSMDIYGALNAGTGNVIIQNKTAGTLIDVGGADVFTASPLTLGITNAELGRITAANTKIGSATAGNINVSAAITTATTNGNVTLQTGTGGISGTGTIAIGAPSLTLDSATTGTLSGAISGTGTLT